MPQGIQQAPHSISEPKGKLLFLFCVSLNHLQFAREMSKLHIAHGKTKPMNLLSMCDFWFRCSCLREPRLTNSNTLQPSLSFLLFFPFFFSTFALNETIIFFVWMPNGHCIAKLSPVRRLYAHTLTQSRMWLGEIGVARGERMAGMTMNALENNRFARRMC